MTTLVIGCTLLIGISIGYFVSLYAGMHVDTKTSKEIKVSPEELYDLIVQLFSDPAKEYENKLERSKERSLILGRNFDSEMLLEGYKEQILGAMSSTPGMKDPYPRDPETQVKDPGPNKMTEEEERIYAEREAKAKTAVTSNEDAIL